MLRWKMVILGLVAYSVFTTTVLASLVERATEPAATLQMIRIAGYVMAGFAGLVVAAEIISHFVGDDQPDDSTSASR